MHHMGGGMDPRDLMAPHQVEKRCHKTRLVHEGQLRPRCGAVGRIAGVA